MIQSKRRHGTHSPYVYSLADNVLSKFPIFPFIFTESQESQYFSKLALAMEAFLQMEHGGVAFENIVRCQPSDAIALSRHADAIIVHTPYGTHLEKLDLYKRSTYPLILDLGGIVVLLSHPSFLRKQFFKLH